MPKADVTAPEQWRLRNEIDRLVTWTRHGRRRPYTEIGIRRLPCVRCGDPAVYQWQICADGRLCRPICERCDIALNELVMRWIGLPDAEQKIEEYRRSKAC